MKRILIFIYEFFNWIGRQNDYLYPNEWTMHNAQYYPFQRPYLWKTRFGFKTSWDLAKIISKA